MKNASISVILNVYKRAAYFEEQLNAIKSQSIKPYEILVWENGNEFTPESAREDLIIARSNKNFGVWARFAFALNAKGEYVCVFDDDTIPGKKWLENCLLTMKQTPGLLGARGVVFENKNSYSLNSDVGIYNPNEETREVDIVGHSWFFKYEWLSTYWGCGNDRFKQDLAGEDIHFSYALQKFLGIPTLVPKHPVDDPDLWGGLPNISKKYGADSAGISKSRDSLRKFENALQHYRNLGFLTLNEKTGSSSRYPNYFYKINRTFPRIVHRLAYIKNKMKHNILKSNSE